MKATVIGNPPGSEGLADRLRDLLERLGVALSVEHCTVGVMLTDDDGIRGYNVQFRGLDEPTDVLSFPSGAGDPSESGHYLGDLVISVERAEEQAREQGHGLGEEVEVLLLHGVLHLQGHDHETDSGEMRELEARLARELFGGTRGLVERSEDTDGGTGTGG